MRLPKASADNCGFSLLELLCVIAVIGILAALLLPALTKARDRARQTQCAGQLKDMAVAFHSFAHDHNNQFPMQVPAAAGGSLEAAPRVSGSRTALGVEPKAYRHFAALAGELRTPKMVICPADTRLPAVSFSVLSNQNLSYFAALNAEFGNANSLLAGDRNLTNDWAPPTSVQRVGPNYLLRWSQELHRFRGNLLFSDGHVDQTADKGLRALNQGGGAVKYALNLPVPSSAPVAASRPDSASALAAPPPNEKASQQTNSADAVVPPGAGPFNSAPTISTEKRMPPNTAPGTTTAVEVKREKPPAVPSSTNNANSAPRPEQAQPSEPGWLVGMIQLLRKFLWEFYAGLFLLALLALHLVKRVARAREDRKPEENWP